MSPTIRSSRAFTLIELLVVISIIGLLSSVVLAGVNGARAKGSLAAGQNFDGHTYAAFYDDLVLSWDFDNDSGTTVQDLSGNGNNLSLTGGALLGNTQNPFKSGQTLSVDSTHTAQKAAPLNKIPTSDFSVSFWVYPTVTDQIHYFISYYLPTEGSWRIGTTDTSTGLIFSFYSGGQARIASAGVLKTNQWYQVVAVCKGTKIALYLNGKITGNTDNVSGCAFASNALSLNGSYPYYIDNVRIYKQALPLSFIKDEYLSGLSNHESFAINVLPR